MARLLYIKLKQGIEIDAKKIEINSKLKARENNTKAKVGQQKVYSDIDVQRMDIIGQQLAEKKEQS